MSRELSTRPATVALRAKRAEMAAHPERFTCDCGAKGAHFWCGEVICDFCRTAHTAYIERKQREERDRARRKARGEDWGAYEP